jgi:hypothetical protein
LSVEAILLTHDPQIGLAELVHKSYARLWPDHPFVFRVPFARATRSRAFTYLSAQANCTMIASPASIKDSMAVLLDGIDDADWVFWCIDDRFPIRLEREAAATVLEAVPLAGARQQGARILAPPFRAGRCVACRLPW